jgi:hypothetical protein
MGTVVYCFVTSVKNGSHSASPLIAKKLVPDTIHENPREVLVSQIPILQNINIQIVFALKSQILMLRNIEVAFSSGMPRCASLSIPASYLNASSDPSLPNSDHCQGRRWPARQRNTPPYLLLPRPQPSSASAPCRDRSAGKPPAW